MPILEFDQWAGSDAGMQSVIPYAPYVYKIPAAEFLLTFLVGNRHLYIWVVRPANKSWVDIESFLACFSRALDVHDDRYEGRRDQEMLLDSFERARTIANETLDAASSGF